MAATATDSFTLTYSREKSLSLASDHFLQTSYVPSVSMQQRFLSHETTLGFVHTTKKRSCDALANSKGRTVPQVGSAPAPQEPHELQRVPNTHQMCGPSDHRRPI